MSVMRWDPFGEAMPLRQMMDRLLEDAVIQPSRSMGQSGGDLGVALDLMETDDALVVKASLPGIKPDDVNLTIHDTVLTIQGEVREEYQSASGTATAASGQPAPRDGAAEQSPQPTTGQSQAVRPRYHHRERRVGRFLRQITLPMAVDSGRAEASFEHGVLTITLPKAEQAKRRTIRISGGGQQPVEGRLSAGGASAGQSAASGQTSAQPTAGANGSPSGEESRASATASR